MRLTKELKSWLSKHAGVPSTVTDDSIYQRAAAEAMFVVDEGEPGHLSQSLLAELTSNAKAAKGASVLKNTLNRIEQRLGGVTPDDLFGDTGHDGVSVGKRSYSSVKTVGTHGKTGKPVLDEHHRPCMMQSELDAAKSGAFLKRLAQRAGIADVRWTEEDQSLLDASFDDKWVGKAGGEWFDKDEPITGSRAKTLLDDAPSGGIEAVPVFFDSDVISTLLLSAEIAPFVDNRTVPRGRRVEGASIGSPQLSWGASEGSAIATFDTSSLVAALDSTIHRVMVAVEVGRDFLSDSPINVGSLLVQGIADRLANELDQIVTDGDGTTQPQGIFQAGGITSVTQGSVAPTIDIMESLLFSVGKQFRKPALRPAFLSNDTTYSRVRGIAVGGGDTRRVFGLDEQSYRLLEYPYRIDNALANTRTCFASLAKFRLYRRMGMEVRWITEGETLARKNTVLLVVNARYGGRVMDANAFATITDGQA